MKLTRGHINRLITNRAIDGELDVLSMTLTSKLRIKLALGIRSS